MLKGRRLRQLLEDSGSNGVANKDLQVNGPEAEVEHHTVED
jgi:hypothetical protein